MALAKEDIINAVAEMSVMEVVELIEAMEEKFGVSAASAVVAGGAAGGGESAAEEQTDFNVILTAAGAKKVGTIKVVRELTGLGLKEAKAMVDEVPSTIKEGISKEEAEQIKAKLEEAGSSVEIK